MLKGPSLGKGPAIGTHTILLFFLMSNCHIICYFKMRIWNRAEGKQKLNLDGETKMCGGGGATYDQ